MSPIRHAVAVAVQFLDSREADFEVAKDIGETVAADATGLEHSGSAHGEPSFRWLRIVDLTKRFHGGRAVESQTEHGDEFSARVRRAIKRTSI